MGFENNLGGNSEKSVSAEEQEIILKYADRINEDLNDLEAAGESKFSDIYDSIGEWLSVMKRRTNEGSHIDAIFEEVGRSDDGGELWQRLHSIVSEGGHIDPEDMKRAIASYRELAEKLKAAV